MEKNLTTGSVLKNVILFSLPYLLSYFLQTLYGMADLFIIGQFDGVASTTAVSIGSQVMHMLTVMIVGLAMGTTVSIGQAIGAGNRRQAARDVGNTIVLFMAVSVSLMAVLLMLVHPIVSAMSTPAEAVDGTAAYLTICFIGIPFITAYNIISSIFRGMGDSKSPMYFIAIACAANIVLDYLFMGFLRLGPAGAALGTTISQAISVAVSLTAVMKRKSIVLKKNDLRPRCPVMGKILKIGIPIAVQDGLIQIAFIVITIIVNHRGLNEAAAVGIVEKVISFLFLVPSSMLSAVSALGAQNIGAGKPDRAVQTLRYAVMIAVGFGILVSIIIQFTAEPIVALFTDPGTADGASVVRFGGQYIRGYIFDCIFAGIHFSFSGYFCACRKSGLSFLHNIIAIVLVRIPGVYLTSKLFPTTLFPMGLATATGSLLSVVICVTAFTVIRRKDRQTESEG
ncbi:MATE family efflux transporter [Lachnoclostridium sp. Marseille-P6806]|uniref:MATE family efflux transporter n=1 Tax=Lachnoclostridium sp. Marseille-P6806 TaxID=2364793 RepID=UPI00102FCE0F|nr:MATE family efflux transporter [Lachnoclostridium sp. Marseille-P6806]